ncbi:hypothetical protein RB653_004664 [Dictyostelium firmibasis]|uniref:Uncharacterized protein n=1 Tax=Dictyostelium firmibasis TaxID=79012 RepID=A0AAN7TZY4_9MYCE
MDSIICKGCNKIYNEPLSLSCGDTLCKNCIGEKCKICNQKITCTILNKTVKSYIESLIVKNCSNHKGQESDISNPKKTTSYCLQCESFNNLDQITAIHTYH